MKALVPLLKLTANKWVELARSAVSPAELERAVPHGFLVGPLQSSGAANAGSFDTLRMAAPVGANASELNSWGLAKGSLTNPFHQMITIGRAANNDVSVEIPSISKFHAFVRVLSDGLVLNDARSANGTWHNGSPVPAGQNALIRDGDSIELARGNVFLYLSSRSFFELVHRGFANAAAERTRDVRREAV